jgi:protein-S-isoprenylcysteine O-methyltransferase Ste14
MNSVLSALQKHRQMIENIFLVLVLGQYIVRETQIDAVFKNPALIDVTFFIHNVIFMLVIVLRREYVKLDRNWFHWGVSILSFFSGLFFIKSSPIQGSIVTAADVINYIGIVVGIVAFLSLGRSFGIVPAVRKIKTRGLYHIVRHPMFVSDILFKIPVVLKYFTIYNFMIFLISLALYIIRARYEEEILSQTEEYQQYQQRVKYRFIPFVY